MLKVYIKGAGLLSIKEVFNKSLHRVLKLEEIQGPLWGLLKGYQ